MQSTSSRWTLDGVDWQKMGISFLLGFTGFASGWFAAEAMPEFNKSNSLWVAFVASQFPVFVNLVRKWAQEQGRLIRESRRGDGE
jgi:hypothetical protein